MPWEAVESIFRQSESKPILVCLDVASTLIGNCVLVVSQTGKSDSHTNDYGDIANSPGDPNTANGFQKCGSEIKRASPSRILLELPIANLKCLPANPTIVACFHSAKNSSMAHSPNSPVKYMCATNDWFAEFTLEFFSEGKAAKFCEDIHLLRNDADGAIGHEDEESDNGHVKQMEASTVQTYFLYYGKLCNQSNMLQDTIRTSTYRRAILENPSDFAGKVVMDVGAGSGILSFFSLQAGASRVYAVEASTVANAITMIADDNPSFAGRVVVLNSTVESLALKPELQGHRCSQDYFSTHTCNGQICSLGNCPATSSNILTEKVDTIVSEPLGTFLFNERMIESYLFARDHFLKPKGEMYPNRCSLSVAPFSDALLHQDMSSRTAFWSNQDFHGIDISSLSSKAAEEQFRQPIIDYIDPNVLVAPAKIHHFDLKTIDRTALQRIQLDLSYEIAYPCLIHGIAGWFDVGFHGQDNVVEFSTSPWSPPTHWYQIRFLFKLPIAVNSGQVVAGNLVMVANRQQSYNVEASLWIEGTQISATTTIIDLKDPDYRYFTNPCGSYYPNAAQPQQQQQFSQPQQQQQSSQPQHSAQNATQMSHVPV